MKTLLILIALPLIAQGLRVFKSNIPVGIDDKVSGLYYKKPANSYHELSYSLTVCARFSFARLSKKCQLFYFKKPNTSEREFLGVSIRYKESGSYPRFGDREEGPGYFFNWVLKDPETNEFNIWSTYRWHHVCFAFNKNTSHVAWVKDGKITNINFVYKNVEKYKLPDDFLDMIYIGRCDEQRRDCSAHSGNISDVNIWNRAMTIEEMINWTDCSSGAQGDLVNWSNSTWEVVNMTGRVTIFGYL